MMAVTTLMAASNQWVLRLCIFVLLIGYCFGIPRERSWSLP